jgi:hypothetical protein
MTKIITVHGTNAGNPNDVGEHWWQKESPFQKRLTEWLDLDGVEIEPFHWDEGPNSEVKRRDAGLALLRRLKEHEEAREDYYLIGHSHGGSVIYHALLDASAGSHPLPHLQSWITVGTPFLSTKPVWFLFSRLGNFGKVAYVGALVGLFELPVIIPLYYLYGREITRAWWRVWGITELPFNLDLAVVLFWIAVVAAYIATFFVIVFSQARMRLRYATKTRNFFKANFLDRWQSLRSQNDEAINALRAAEPLKLRLFRSNLLVGPAKTFVALAIVIWTLTGAIGAGVLWYKYGLTKDYALKLFDYNKLLTYGLVSRGQLELPDAPNPIDLRLVRFFFTGFYANYPLQATMTMVAYCLASILMLYGTLWLAISITGLIARLAGSPASWLLNRLTVAQLRTTAFGNDTIGEQVVQVGGVPEGCDGNYGLVPEEIETALTAFSDKNAAKTLASVRQILGLNQETHGQRDIAKIIAEQMSWHELIHTAYFEVDEFAKLIAHALHNAGLAPVSESFQSDPDYEKIRLAYEHLPPLVVQTSNAYTKRKSRRFLGLGRR